MSTYIYQPKIEYNDAAGVVQTIEFEYPPEGDPLNEQLVAKWKEKYSESGQYVRVFKYTLHRFKLKFKFINPDIAAQIQAWYLAHGQLGEDLKLFPQADETDFHTVRCMTKSLKFDRGPYDHSLASDDNFYRSFTLDFERTV